MSDIKNATARPATAAGTRAASPKRPATASRDNRPASTWGRGPRITPGPEANTAEWRTALDYEDFTYRRGWRTYDTSGGACFARPKSPTRKPPHESDAAAAQRRRDEAMRAHPEQFIRTIAEPIRARVSSAKFYRNSERKHVQRHKQHITPAHAALRTAASARQLGPAATLQTPPVVTLETTKTPLTAAEVIAFSARGGGGSYGGYLPAPPSFSGEQVMVPHSEAFEAGIRTVRSAQAATRNAGYAAAVDTAHFAAAHAVATSGGLLAASGNSLAQLRRTFKRVQAAAFENTRADLLPTYLKPPKPKSSVAPLRATSSDSGGEKGLTATVATTNSRPSSAAASGYQFTSLGRTFRPAPPQELMSLVRTAQLPARPSTAPASASAAPAAAASASSASASALSATTATLSSGAIASTSATSSSTSAAAGVGGVASAHTILLQLPALAATSSSSGGIPFSPINSPARPGSAAQRPRSGYRPPSASGFAFESAGPLVVRGAPPPVTGHVPPRQQVSVSPPRSPGKKPAEE